ncbi:MAG: peptidase M52, partial [Chloroflexota bacterium]
MRVLVAGVGNIFLSDDGFGPTVLRHLDREQLPRGVNAVDFGISSLHLAYELLNDYDAVLLIDAVQRGGVPGTLYVIELEPDPAEDGAAVPLLDPHAMTPDWALLVV